MKRENREPRVYPPPDDGREWILADEAAQRLDITRHTLYGLAKRLDWTRTCRPGVKAWLLKKDFDHYLWFIKERERWYKQQRPKTWKPMIDINPSEEEALFKRIYLTTAQAAAYMGVSKCTILQ